MADNQYEMNRISSWDNNAVPTSFNPSRSIHSISSIPVSSSTNYVVPYSRYSQIHPQPNIHERPTQQYQPRMYQSQPIETFKPIQTNTSKASESGWFAKHVTVTRVLGLLFGLIITGVPLAVIVTMYLQLSLATSSNTTTTTASSSAVSNSIPYQCTSYVSNSDSTRLTTYLCSSCYCDNGLSGWYRFIGSSGSRLATTPVSPGYCGANYPGWFNGTHPTTNYTTNIGSLCVYFSGNICYPTYSIGVVPVTNCGSFYVYYLTPVSYCYTRYCTVL